VKNAARREPPAPAVEGLKPEAGSRIQNLRQVNEFIIQGPTIMNVLARWRS
jgi:hypothetical protein